MPWRCASALSLLLLQVDSMPRPAIPYVRCAAERGSAYPRFSRWDYQFTARKKETCLKKLWMTGSRVGNSAHHLVETSFTVKLCVANWAQLHLTMPQNPMLSGLQRISYQPAFSALTVELAGAFPRETKPDMLRWQVTGVRPPDGFLRVSQPRFRSQQDMVMSTADLEHHHWNLQMKKVYSNGKPTFVAGKKRQLMCTLQSVPSVPSILKLPQIRLTTKGTAYCSRFSNWHIACFL